MSAWEVLAWPDGEVWVYDPGGARYVVTAHTEATQSPIPEDAVHVDRITRDGTVVYDDGRGFLAAVPAEVTMLTEAALLKQEEA